MSAEADRIVREYLDIEHALAYAYGRLAVEAGQAAADLFAAANAHNAAHGPTDTFCAAAWEAVEVLSRLVAHLGAARSEILTRPVAWRARAFFLLVALFCVVAAIDSAAHGDWPNAGFCLLFAAGTRVLYRIATDERV